MSNTTSNKTKIVLITLIFVLLSAFILGVLYLSSVDVTQDQVGNVSYGTWMLIAYAAGLSMIILPCTLPLVFIIVPLSMGKGYKKGLTMAILFGLGLIITISLYGIAVSLLGQFTGLDRATRVMWLVAGLFAYMFGIVELKLLRIKLPSYSKTPKFIQKRGDYVKSFFMGLLLGNAGVGCPNPFFYVLLAYIASSGSIAVGGSLGFLHGAGRAMPLIMISILAIVGVNISKKLIEKRETVERWTGWGLIIIGAFIFLNGLFGHDWWERSPIHFAWNTLLQRIGFIPEITLGGQVINYTILTVFVLLVVIPITWYIIKKRSKKEKNVILSIISIVTILIVLGVGYYFETRKPDVIQTGELKEFNVKAFQWGFEPQFIEVEEGDRVILNVESTDVTHGIGIDEFSINETIVPGEITTIDFIADKVGTFQFYCSIVCGEGHVDQKGFLIVKKKGEEIRTPVNIESKKTNQPINVDGAVESNWFTTIEKTTFTTLQKAGNEIKVRSMHDGVNIYFLLRWQDDTQSNTTKADTDRIALSFDISDGADIAMGAAGVPHITEAQKTIGEGVVDIWHWKAFDSHTSQPNVIDDEFAGPFEQLKEHYYRDDDNKYGGNNDLQAAGQYNASTKTWTVEIVRPLQTNDTNIKGFGEIDKQLQIGKTFNISFAIWDGETETGGEHKTTNWEHLIIK